MNLSREIKYLEKNYGTDCWNNFDSLPSSFAKEMVDEHLRQCEEPRVSHELVLTKTECENMIENGYSIEDIAFAFDVSEKTIISKMTKYGLRQRYSYLNGMIAVAYKGSQEIVCATLKELRRKLNVTSRQLQLNGDSEGNVHGWHVIRLRRKDWIEFAGETGE